MDKCSSNRLRRCLLQESKLTLEKVIEIAQAMELQNSNRLLCSWMKFRLEWQG